MPDMLQPLVRLESTTDSLILDANNGWGITDINLGDAQTREVAAGAPDADGTLDYTSWTGSRVITLGLEIVPVNLTLWQMQTKLRGFTNLRTSLKFYIQPDASSPELVATIRRSQFTMPLDNMFILHPQLQWVVPSGILESSNLYQVNINPASSTPEVGRNYSVDRVYDRTYPSSPILGTGIIAQNGNTDAYPILRVYGPCTNPVIFNDTQGKTLAFTGLTINAGEYLEIDTRFKTVRYLGLANDSRYANLSFTLTKWWTLGPGINNIRFIPITSSGACQLQIYYRDAYL